MRKLFLILMTVIFAGLGLSAQTRTYHGTVLDAETNEPLIGATVMPVGGGQGTATDIDGRFNITVPLKVHDVTISYVGYQAVTVPLTDNMTVKLNTSASTLNDLMVVAFGTTTKEAFTGSAAVVNASDIQKHTTTNVADALVGSVPGLQMRSTTGAPGSSQGSMSIRGINSLYSGTEPLVIVDGAPYSANLSNISQNDIASISVLKDAASAALYGARGASGVIIITTKKGANREAEINVNAKWGGNTRAVQDYDYITDPGEYYEAYFAELYNYNFYRQGMSAAQANAASNAQLLNHLVYNVFTVPEGETLIGMDGKMNPKATLGRMYEFNGQRRFLTPDNYNDEAYRTGFRQEYNLSINGGTERASFYASLNYLGDEGILKPSSFDRFSGRIRADYQAKKWLKVGANIGYTHSATVGNSDLSSSNLGAGNVLYFTSSIAPIYPLYVRSYDDAGNPYIIKDEFGNNTYDFGVSNYYAKSRPFSAPGNAVGAQALDQARTVGNQLNATFNATFQFTDYLKLDVVSNVTWGLTQYTYYCNMNNPLNSNVKGKLAKDNTNTIRTNNTQTLTFYKQMGDHYLNVLAGHEYYRSDQQYLYGYAEGGFSPTILELAAFANRQINTTSNKSRYNVEGWFGSLQYNYLEKYYASASYRRDASSRFAKAHRWGNFWSVGAAWVINKESFMDSTKSWLDYLKLKFSIGQQGNDNISSSYAWIDMYNLQIASPTQMSPVFNKGFGNPDLTWETTTNLNVGLEFGLFDNRLNGSIDFYNKSTSNLLFWLSVPESTGARGYYGNMGTIRNTGVELTLSGSPIKTADYEWLLSANLSHNKSKIVSLPADKTKVNGGFYESPYWYTEGGNMYEYMTLAFAGLNEQGESLYYYDPNLIQEGGQMTTSKPGTVKSMDYVTTNSGEASRYLCGSTLPTVYGGFSTTVRVKWFDITATFDYQIGGKVYDSRYASLMGPNTSLDGTGAGGNIHKDYIKSWSPNNTSSNIPRWQVGDTNGNQACDRYLTNAGYLNFQSFTVGFTFPKFWNEIEKLRIYCAGENLCFWSARKGLDPRYSFSGNTSIGTYSPMRSISGGVEVTF